MDGHFCRQNRRLLYGRTVYWHNHSFNNEIVLQPELEAFGRGWHLGWHLGGLAGCALPRRHRNEYFHSQRSDFLPSHVTKSGKHLACNPSKETGAMGGCLELDALVWSDQRGCVFGPPELEPLASGSVFLPNRCHVSIFSRNACKASIGMAMAMDF